MTKKALADEIGVSARAVTGWETDDYPPEHIHLAKLVKVLRFPSAFFELDEPAGTTAEAVSFRSLSKKSAGQRDAVLSMCDIAVDFVRWVEQGFGLPGPQIPNLYNESPKIAAELLRQEWGLGNKPVKNMMHLLEAKGIRVLSLAENCREIDACSFMSDGTPFVLLNTTVSNERMRFDMAHELAHLVLHNSGENVGREAEKEANRFASEFLMPQASIVAHRPRLPVLDELVRHKKFWDVSVAALAYRLHQEGYISDWNFKSLNIEMGRRKYRATEPHPSPMETSYVFEVVLKRLREKQMPLSFVANQLSVPVGEIREMMTGIAKIAFDGNAEHSSTDQRSTKHLRVIK